ncbi:hypothetical protein ACLETS_23150 [Enterobacter ludwigii]|uniref:hypothetical protein n=1 Tax=Enterobacter ludwigii TaxID=299767 RepID=UPI0039762715
MNAKIIHTGVAISLLVVLVFGYITFSHFRENKNPELNCGANTYLQFSLKDGVFLQANAQIVIHFVNQVKKQSYVTEYGDVTFGGDHYVLDRNVRLMFQESNINGFSEVHREGVDKNDTDNLPDSIAKKIFSAQTVYFYKIDKISNEVWRLSDLRRTILVCRVIS